MSQLGQLLIETITHSDPAIRDRSVRELAAQATVAEKLEACEELEQFRGNRAKSLRAGPRLARPARPLPLRDPGRASRFRESGLIPFPGFVDLMERRYEQAIATFRDAMKPRRPERRDLQRACPSLRADRLSEPGRPGAEVGPELSGQPLDVPGRTGRRAPAANPSCAAVRDPESSLFPILIERTRVRLDLSHSGWSDIFFLGMDFPEGARVLNISVDLGVHGRDAAPGPRSRRACG